jgi:hypothetical protein
MLDAYRRLIPRTTENYHIELRVQEFEQLCKAIADAEQNRNHELDSWTVGGWIKDMQEGFLLRGLPIDCIVDSDLWAYTKEVLSSLLSCVKSRKPAMVSFFLRKTNRVRFIDNHLFSISTTCQRIQGSTL